MTLYQFNALGDDEKANATWEGSFVGSRSSGIMMIQLYALPEFYVEVSYASANNQIIGFRSFSNVNLLEPYLKDIDISALLH